MNTTKVIRIVVRGRLSARLAAAFEGLTVARRGRTTELRGSVVDNAQLHGLLARIRDLGLDLESVAVSEADAAAPPNVERTAVSASRLEP
jgi:hypothetical protein